jgi:hypothetical protein
MKLLILTFTIFFFYSCNSQTIPKKIKMSSSTWSFKEGTVGRIGEHKVMFSNIMLQDYTLADGTVKEGNAASLSLPNTKDWQTAGVGHLFTLDGVTYEVVNVEDATPFGQVTVVKNNN